MKKCGADGKTQGNLEREKEVSDKQDKGSYIMSNYDDDPLAGHRGGGGCTTLVVSLLTFMLLLITIVV